MNCFSGKFDGLELPADVSKDEIVSITDDCKEYWVYRYQNLNGVGPHFVHFSNTQQGRSLFCSRFLCKDCGTEVAIVLKTPTDHPTCPKCNRVLK